MKLSTHHKIKSYIRLFLLANGLAAGLYHGFSWFEWSTFGILFFLMQLVMSLTFSYVGGLFCSWLFGFFFPIEMCEADEKVRVGTTARVLTEYEQQEIYNQSVQGELAEFDRRLRGGAR